MIRRWCKQFLIQNALVHSFSPVVEPKLAVLVFWPRCPIRNLPSQRNWSISESVHLVNFWWNEWASSGNIDVASPLRWRAQSVMKVTFVGTETLFVVSARAKGRQLRSLCLPLRRSEWSAPASEESAYNRDSISPEEESLCRSGWSFSRALKRLNVSPLPSLHLLSYKFIDTSAVHSASLFI